MHVIPQHATQSAHRFENVMCVVRGGRMTIPGESISKIFMAEEDNFGIVTKIWCIKNKLTLFTLFIVDQTHKFLLKRLESHTQ